MASGFVVRKKVTMGVEIGSRHSERKRFGSRRGERKRFDNTFREERNLLWRD